MTQVGNWIGESTSSTGTGSLILDGAFEGYTEFSSYGDGDYWYTIVNGLNREAGICTIIGSTFVRTTIHSTLDSGVFNDVSPVPLALVDTSEIYVTFNKEAYDEIMTLIASGGIGVGTVTSVVGQAPIVITGTATVNPTVTISPATTSTAGSISGDDKLKLDGIAAGAQVNVPTDLTNVPDATTVALNSSTGADTTLPAATTSLAGVMTGADKTKLNAITGTNTGDQTTAVTAPILNSGTAAAPIIGSRVFGGAALSGHVPDPITESQRYLMDDGSWQIGSGALTAEWLFDVSVDMISPPAITYMRTNGTTLENSTQVTVNKNTLDTGLNHGTANVLPGDILLVMDDSRNASSRYTVVSKVDNGTWVLLNVTHEAGSGNPLSNDHMLVTWIPDALTTGGGDVTGPALATANAIPRYNGTTGKVIKDSSITIADGATGTLSGTNSGDNAANTTSNTYADGKVAQTLTDGVTISAPSQNVVFDALALKAPLASPVFSGIPKGLFTGSPSQPAANFVVVAALPGTPDANTIYFVTGP